MTYDRWLIKEPLKVSEEISEYFPNQWVQQRLSELNITDIPTAKGFLDAAQYQSSDPAELPDLEKSAKRLWQAIQDRELIGVWGDFDVDGQTSTTLLVEGLKDLGANVVFHIPNRDKESHGIRLPYLKKFLNDNPVKILLTCDTGVSENDSVDFAKEHEVDVIITDHHTLPDDLPDAYGIVNPQRLPGDHKLSGLAGVGTAYKLMEYLFSFAGKANESTKLLDLTALGTIADVAPLRGENRYLVQQGLKNLQNTNRLLLKEIYQINRFEPDKLSETHISFFLAPMLNAIGRLDDANPVVSLLLSENLQDTKIFASVLVNLNEKRRFLTEQITKASIEILEQQDEKLDQPAIVLYHSGWNPGVIGIVANRLVEKYLKPVIILTDKGEISNPELNSNHPDLSTRSNLEIFGSGRSIAAVNLVAAIRENQEYLTHFGGHAMAAGLSLPFENLEEFKNGLFQSINNQIGDQIISRDLLLDGILNLDQINLDFVKELESLAPFGAGNPPLKFFSKNLTLLSQKSFGVGANHLRLTVNDENNNIKDIIWWRGNDEFTGITDNVDIAYQLSSSSYKGKEQIQIELIDIRPSEQLDLAIKKKAHLSIIDFRSKEEMQNTIPEAYEDILFWKEDSSPFEFSSTNRLGLHQAKTLVIVNSPPNMLTLAKAFLKVNPETLILAGKLTGDDSPGKFINDLRKLINYAINQKSGLIDIDRMAAAIGHRETTIDFGLRWLASKGEITMTEHPDTSILVKWGGEQNEELLPEYYSQMIFLLKETFSFRKWYFSLSPEKLQDELVHYISKK